MARGPIATRLVVPHERRGVPRLLAWAELQRRGSIRPRYLRNLEDEVGSELARCLDPFVHEQDIRPYGAIVAREMPHLERLGRIVDTTGLSRDVIRSLADGRHSLVLVVKGLAPQLLLLHEPMDTDQDYASHAVWVDGVIICNDSQRHRPHRHRQLGDDGRRAAVDREGPCVRGGGRHRPGRAGRRTARSCGACWSCRTTASAPNKFGATLLYVLTEEALTLRRRDEGVDVTTLDLSVLNPADEPLLLHQARYRDGALLVGRDGRLLAVNVIMRPTRASEQAVAVTKGTRHTSAARHTYDCPDMLAFVVSTDGPVTVFCDGQRIADLKRAAFRKTAETIDEPGGRAADGRG